MPRGRFITLEGGEGAGKTVQAARLRDALEAHGVGAVLTREPGGSPGAEEIRRLLVSGPVERWEPLAEAMLHAAARRDHLLHTIEPALERGLWVISDRFVDSMIVYQGYGQGADLDVVERLSDLSLGGFEPDLTVVLDIPVADGTQAGRRARGIEPLRAYGHRFSREGAARLPRPCGSGRGALRGCRCHGGPRHGRSSDPEDRGGAASGLVR